MVASTWDMAMEKLLLNLMCFHRPMGKQQDANYLQILTKMNEKYPEITMDNIKQKIGEYYDMVGLSKLDSKEGDVDDHKEEVDSNDVDSKEGDVDADSAEEEDEDEDEEKRKNNKHVIIDEDKNRIFDGANQPASESIAEQKEEEDEEPVHLTRSQARKLQKEAKEQDKLVSKPSPEAEQRQESEDIETGTESDMNISTVLESEPEEAPMARRRGRRSKSDAEKEKDKQQREDITPRRSTRLRRRSDTNEDDTTDGADGKRTRSTSGTRDEADTSTVISAAASPISTGPTRRGRKRKSVSLPVSDVPEIVTNKRTRSKRREETVPTDAETESEDEDVRRSLRKRKTPDSGTEEPVAKRKPGRPPKK